MRCGADQAGCWRLAVERGAVMADPIQAKTDFSGVLAGLDRLKGAARESLARSMAVAMDVVRQRYLALPTRPDYSRDQIFHIVPLAA